MNGIIVINKPQEMTSFDCVAIMRRKLGIKRIGHLGTLDPMATGVLPIAVGKATRIMDYLDMDIKEYVGEIAFGLRSDTDDIWGKIVPSNKSDGTLIVDKVDVEKALACFRGVIHQVPPIYAAIKKDGKKLYEYARKGQNIEIESRKIYIESIELMDFTERKSFYEGTLNPGEAGGINLPACPAAVIRIRCSKGTYIRSIARDIGEKLGCGAVLSGLIRTSSGAFKYADAISMNTIMSLPDYKNREDYLGDIGLDQVIENEIGKKLFPVDYALRYFPKVDLGDWESKLFSTGVKLRSDQWQVSRDFYEGESVINSFPLELKEDFRNLYRVYGKNGFIGTGLKLETGELKADKVLA